MQLGGYLKLNYTYICLYILCMYTFSRISLHLGKQHELDFRAACSMLMVQHDHSEYFLTKVLVIIYLQINCNSTKVKDVPVSCLKHISLTILCNHS